MDFVSNVFAYLKWNFSSYLYLSNIIISTVLMLNALLIKALIYQKREIIYVT